MSKKLKRLSILLMSILLIVSLLPTTAFAAGKIDTAQLPSLNIYYQNGGRIINGAKFDLYKVADVDAYSQMTLTEAFEPLKDKISGLADLESTEDDDAWRELARTLKSYASDFSGALFRSGEIDKNGNLTFDELECGLYLVIGSRRTIGSYHYTVDPFLVFLPGRSPESEEWTYEYDISVEPKSTRKHEPGGDDDDTISRKVIKVWEDDDDAEGDRPHEIEVELLRDGKAVKTVRLNERNNWRHTWNDLSDRYDWDVREVDVPDSYRVKISRSGTSFVITNTYKTPPPPPPGGGGDTPPGGGGDTPPSVGGNPPGGGGDNPPGGGIPGTLPQTGLLWWPVPILLSAGAVLVLVGVVRRRRCN